MTARETVIFPSVMAAGDASTGRPDMDGMGRGWALGVDAEEAKRLCRTGWEDGLSGTLDLISAAVQTARQTVLRPTWQARWDVTGDHADIGRYLSGEPDCMRDYVRRRRDRVSRVVTVCGSVGYSAAVSADTIRRRGEILSAFCLALSEMGYGTELWADMSFRERKPRSGTPREGAFRVQVKHATERLDPAVILYAYAHPAFLRKILVGAYAAHPVIRRTGVRWGERFYPVAPAQDLPDGTVYLPEIHSSHDVPNADKALEDLLRQAGLIR